MAMFMTSSCLLGLQKQQQPLQLSRAVTGSVHIPKYHDHVRNNRIVSSNSRIVSCFSLAKTLETLATCQNFQVLKPLEAQEKLRKPLAMVAILSGSVLMATRFVAATVAAIIMQPNPNMQSLASIPGSVFGSRGLLFFAATRVATPMTVIAAAMQKWLDLYAVLLTARILFSWFPNIPWDRQPFAAMRDLSDPYLTLFRNIIPPVKNVLDVSPLLAFAVLGFFRTVLENALYVTV